MQAPVAPMPDVDMPEHQLRVGVCGDVKPEVAVDLGVPCTVVSFPPEFAVHFAQLLVKNARLAGYTGPFVELPVQGENTLN